MQEFSHRESNLDLQVMIIQTAGKPCDGCWGTLPTAVRVHLIVLNMRSCINNSMQAFPCNMETS